MLPGAPINPLFSRPRGICHHDCRLRSTVLGVSGEDYAIIASDTRLSEGYSIHTRDQPKAYKL